MRDVEGRAAFIGGRAPRRTRDDYDTDPAGARARAEAFEAYRDRAAALRAEAAG